MGPPTNRFMDDATLQAWVAATGISNLTAQRDYNLQKDMWCYTLTIPDARYQKLNYQFHVLASTDRIDHVSRKLDLTLQNLLYAAQQSAIGGNNNGVSGQSNQAAAGHTAAALLGPASGGSYPCAYCGQQAPAGATFCSPACKRQHYARMYGAPGLPQGPSNSGQLNAQAQLQQQQQQMLNAQKAFNNYNSQQAHQLQVSYGIAVYRRARLDEFPKLETTETRLGELTGYRGWNVQNDRLCSTSAKTLWAPGCVMHGDTKSIQDHCGVHSFKTLKDFKESGVYSHCDVIGVVALWGDVIEHECGYRSEYAKITGLIEFRSGRKSNKSFLNISGQLGLRRLRKAYGLNSS